MNGKVIKLSKDLRDKIKTKIMDKCDKFQKRRDAVKKRKEKLALAIYRHVRGKEEEAMNAAPVHWFSTNKKISVDFKGINDSYYRYTELRFPEGIEKRFCIGDRSGAFATFDAGTPLHERWIKICREIESIVKDEEKLLLQISTTLNSCTTVTNLLKVWPQIKDVVDEVVGEHSTTSFLPVVPIANLNKELGL